MAGEQGSDRGRSGRRKGDDARAQRLRAALRENLKRRKSQARGRADSGSADSGSSHDSAGIGAEIAPDKPKG